MKDIDCPHVNLVSLIRVALKKWKFALLKCVRFKTCGCQKDSKTILVTTFRFIAISKNDDLITSHRQVKASTCNTAYRII